MFNSQLSGTFPVLSFLLDKPVGTRTNTSSSIKPFIDFVIGYLQGNGSRGSPSVNYIRKDPNT